MHDYVVSVCHTNIVSQSRALDADRYTNAITDDLNLISC
jgi:hypothetical protein